MYKENAELKEKNTVLNDAIQHYKTIEDTIQSTLIMAQNAAEETKKNAEQKAEQILLDAQLTVSKSTEDINQQIVMKRCEYDELKNQFDVYKAKMESLLI